MTVLMEAWVTGGEVTWLHVSYESKNLSACFTKDCTPADFVIPLRSLMGLLEEGFGLIDISPLIDLESLVRPGFFSEFETMILREARSALVSSLKVPTEKSS